MKKLFFLLILLFPFSFCLAQKSFFESDYKQLINTHLYDGNLDYSTIDIDKLEQIYGHLQGEYLLKSHLNNSIHHLINVYNFLVIYSIRHSYPISSVKEIPDFFTKKYQLGKSRISLDELEALIIKESHNAFLHLLLNCGARSCPNLIYLESDQKLESYIIDQLGNKNILDIKPNKLHLSSIFYWYKSDFGDHKTLLTDLKNYLAQSDITDHTIQYLDFDWSLNDISTDNYLIYYPTKLYKKGGGELKIFNNYYTQTEFGIRSNFYSGFFQFLFGTNKNFNWGFDIKLRSVNQGKVPLFSALNFNNTTIDASSNNSFARVGISGIGPRIKYQPFKDKPNINLLHSIYFVPMDDAEGNQEYGYSDFQHLQIFNNLYIEKSLNVNRRIFWDIGFWIENLNLSNESPHFMQIQFPVTFIYSLIPSPKFNYYFLANSSMKPIYNRFSAGDSNWKLTAYGQLGMGSKYYLTNNLELEILYTYFYDGTPDRVAHTFNIGIRVFKF